MPISSFDVHFHVLRRLIFKGYLTSFNHLQFLYSSILIMYVGDILYISILGFVFIHKFIPIYKLSILSFLKPFTRFLISKSGYHLNWRCHNCINHATTNLFQPVHMFPLTMYSYKIMFTY